MTLSSRIEAASGPDRELDAEIAKSVGWRVLYDDADPNDREPYYQPVPEQSWTTVLRYTASIDAALTLVPYHKDEDGNPLGQMKWSIVPGAKTDFKPFNERTTVKTDSARVDWFWVAHVFGHRAEAATPALALAAAAIKIKESERAD